ncbi:MAG: tRNA (adenosine(37)-N6)-threonylcarbamoyltransferase complex dimerization subunit type 1 TsaB [Candidatus Omnitrophica bacterium]|nr:tRNA (adenosine(37)-N6)-threonylcarbamoyltransferase complex dimerization subunit type 1 TsaB [Candidatus Omnitrophota bacterium]
MNILAIDSSSENLSISMLNRGNVLFDFNRCLKFGASKLVSFIDGNLRKYHINLDDIDVFALGMGPGSFTGLRASFSVVKAFMIALRKPAVCVESFYSMAYPFIGKHRKIAVISDARRGLVYAATFLSERGLLKKETKTSLTILKDFAHSKSGYFFITYDEHLYRELSEINPKINFNQKTVYPKAKYYLEIAQNLAGKKRFVGIDNLKPLYLHPKTCQVRNVKI